MPESKRPMGRLSYVGECVAKLRIPICLVAPTWPLVPPSNAQEMLRSKKTPKSDRTREPFNNTFHLSKIRAADARLQKTHPRKSVNFLVGSLMRFSRQDPTLEVSLSLQRPKVTNGDFQGQTQIPEKGLSHRKQPFGPVVGQNERVSKLSWLK